MSSRCCPSHLHCTACLRNSSNDPFSPFHLYLGLSPCHRLIRFFVFFQVLFFSGLSLSFSSTCIAQQSVIRVFGPFNTCTSCPADPLQHLFALPKVHCHLVACPSFRCHQCQGPSFIRGRWLPTDQSPASEYTPTDRELRLEHRDGEEQDVKNRRLVRVEAVLYDRPAHRSTLG